jgi:hypothetical protein
VVWHGVIVLLTSLIINGPFLVIAQNLIRSLYFLELFGVTTLIWMVLQSHLFVCLSDFILATTALNT